MSASLTPAEVSDLRIVKARERMAPMDSVALTRIEECECGTGDCLPGQSSRLGYWHSYVIPWHEAIESVLIGEWTS